MEPAVIPDEMLRAFHAGTVIPAMPLALTEERSLDERRQVALLRYYVDAGSGGVAVGVHSTQFEIRLPKFGLYRPVLELASGAIDAWRGHQGPNLFKIAGVMGNTAQAVAEAALARSFGYHACLLSLAGLSATEAGLIAHSREVASVMPLIGFYLQPAVGGRPLSAEFWRGFAEIEGVVGIKIAPFDRYRTLDVVRAVCEAGAEKRIALYTGNDDNLLIDLLTPYRFPTADGTRSVRIVGGLLGQWGVWTKAAVELLRRVHELAAAEAPVPQELLARSVEITDANAAIFDAAHSFAGVIPGVHTILRRQGLFRGIWCLDPSLTLSPGQSAEIDRVCAAYPHLTDDDFVRANLERWLTP